LEGGAAGEQDVVANEIVTSANRTYNRQFTVAIQEL
jgi:hypothetical protein